MKYIKVPFKELEKMEEERCALIDYLSENLNGSQLHNAIQLTRQIWHVGNTKVWMEDL